jgi:hypothetical protein
MEEVEMAGAVMVVMVVMVVVEVDMVEVEVKVYVEVEEEEEGITAIRKNTATSAVMTIVIVPACRLAGGKDAQSVTAAARPQRLAAADGRG